MFTLFNYKFVNVKSSENANYFMQCTHLVTLNRLINLEIAQFQKD